MDVARDVTARVLAAARTGAAPAVALMRLLLSGLSAATVLEELRRLRATPDTASPLPHDRIRALSAAAEASHAGLVTVERLVAAGADHGATASADAGLHAIRAMFDRLVQVSPAASVAAYSLGEPERLDAATREVCAWLRDRDLLGPATHVLDLGCGIGRFCAALAPETAGVTGVELSAGMLRQARRRCAGIANVSLVMTDGRALDCLRDAAFDLILAVDTFPYLVQAGPALAADHVAAARRLLRPGGSLLIVNFSYRDDGAEADERDIANLAAAHGFELRSRGDRPFAAWDGAVFWLLRPGGTPT